LSAGGRALDAEAVADFARRAGAAAGLRLRLELAAAMPEKRLSARERAQCAALPRFRRLSWRRGRGGLKALLAEAGEPLDTSGLRFPNPRFSVSHCGRRTVVAAVSPGGRVRGLGVDLQLGRAPRGRAARHFLDARELALLRSLPRAARARELLRRWTIKEALFKADPRNSRRLLLDYSLEDAPGGDARDGLTRGTAGPGREYFWASFPTGFLALAVFR
jgi:hypothetical protein